jgi:hypothetical protein
MKIQKPGRFWGVARTLDGELACDAKDERRDACPQKINISENIRLAIVPPISAISIPAMTMFVNVEVKRNAKMKRNIKAACKRRVSIKSCSEGPRVSKQTLGAFHEKEDIPAHEPHL